MKPTDNLKFNLKFKNGGYYMDTGGVRGLVQRFEEIREVQASQSTRDAGLGGLKRRKL
jgi:hypothetical protein